MVKGKRGSGGLGGTGGLGASAGIGAGIKTLTTEARTGRLGRDCEPMSAAATDEARRQEQWEKASSEGEKTYQRGHNF